MGSWKDYKDRQLKKIVYALDDHTINRLIKDHEDRGWIRGSQVKEYRYGLGCLMIFKSKKEA